MKTDANGSPATGDTAVIVAPEHGGAIAKASNRQNSILTTVDMEGGLPNMDDYEAAPLDLASQYWAPEAEGEFKNLLFSHIGESMVPDKFGPNKNDPNATVALETAHFFEMAEGQVVSVRQASKVLLSTLKSIGAVQGTMLQIVFKGRKKLSNGNMGDTWAVYPLRKKA